MRQTFLLSEKMKQFIYILLPILVTQIGMFSMNLFDTMMSGHFSADDLAGVAIGASLWVPVFTGLGGILLSITPIVAQLIGAERKKEVPHSVLQGVYAAIALSLTVFIIGYFTLDLILDRMTLEENVRRIAREYVIALSFGIIPLFVSMVFRCFIDALGMTRTSMIITLIALPLNVLFNYVLIFGKWGFPALGGVGSGYASAITYWLIAFLGAWIIHRHQPFNEYRIFKKFPAVSLIEWKNIFQIGVPIGLSIFFETSIFSAVTLFMSNYSTHVIAAHQIAISFASLIYMIPLSISMSLTILVGFEVGAKRLKDAKAYSWLGVATAASISVVCTILLFLFREHVAGLYTKNAEVIELTTHFLLFAAIFQLSDAIQAPVQGALRGYKDVNITFVMTMISYWVIGLPLGYYLANYTEFEAFGYWIGLISGLTAGAITLSWRLLRIQKQKEVSY
ncbi:MATE family multidrug resistance protein [Bacillus ectoiniformans]|uniref:MATE family efflux transporter n=1 Tax=Bacillus ectoiniformans TaxID=1494429 RepID=UPI00195AF76A|nr:MATE family efflux transporter [Bacillus ectoiniformans]MBM7647884.1 MATE family multidrug resistance protein [Bacillus ectoiniformans]